MKGMIEDRKEMEQILDRARVGRLAMSGDEEPYVVPLNFVYKDGRIYFHCGLEGRKLDMMDKRPRVCFEVDELLSLELQDQPCLADSHFYSVIAWGNVTFLEELDEKKDAIDHLIKKYGFEDKEYQEPPEAAYSMTNVGVIQVDKMTGKKSVPDDES